MKEVAKEPKRDNDIPLYCLFSFISGFLLASALYNEQWILPITSLIVAIGIAWKYKKDRKS